MRYELSTRLTWPSMSHLRHRIGLVVACLISITTAALPAVAQDFSDSFEINPFWAVTQQNGTIQLSQDLAHSGIQSVKLTGTGGGQVNVWLSHTFPSESQGTLSVWFYDTGTTGIYAGLYAFSSNPASSPGFSVDVADWDPSTYVWYGPGMTATATSIARTVGWHNLKLQVTPTVFSALLDNAVVGSLSGNFTFNEVRLLVSGPSETGTFYFDDFSFAQSAGGPASTISVSPSLPVGRATR